MLLAYASVDVYAQLIPVSNKFGKVSKEELEMAVYEPDTSAVAVVLYEGTDIMIGFTANLDFMQKTSKHLRIKILKEEGLNWGDFELIHYYTNQYQDLISGVEAVTYNLENGKIVSSKMPKGNVFDGDYVENYKKMTFAAVNVKAGSVIEVKYDIRSDMYWHIDDVYFQRNIPVNLSECEIRIPDMFTFNRKSSGYHDLGYVSETKSSLLHLGSDTFQYNTQIDRYKVIDLPAFKKEPYMYNARQYYASVHYDTKSILMPGRMVQDLSVTWDDVDKNYMNSDLMQRFRAQCHFKDEVAAVSNEAGDIQRIAEAVSIVKKKVMWNKEYELLPSPAGQVIKAGVGTNADINCLVAGCLREMGYTVDPVMIKLRSSGLLLEFQPELHPYDTFLLEVKAADGTCYYVDGGSDNAYVNVLDPLMLVSNGRVLRSDGGSWVDLRGLSRNNVVMTVNASVGQDMLMYADVDKKFSGLESFEEKNIYMSFKDEEGYMDMIEEDASVEIGEFVSENVKAYTDQMSLKYDFTKELDAVGDMIYINPFVETFHSRTAFQAMTRLYPIDFPSDYSVTYMFNMPIPEGYAVEQLPEVANVKMGPLNAALRLAVYEMGGQIRISFSYSQKTMTGQVKDYEDIRNLWQYLNKVYDSMIILKKVS